MAQGEFTKEEVDETGIAVVEMFNAVPKIERGEYIDRLSNILLFLAAVRTSIKEKSDK